MRLCAAMHWTVYSMWQERQAICEQCDRFGELETQGMQFWGEWNDSWIIL